MEAKRLLHGRPKGLNYNIDSIPPFILIDAFEDLAQAELDSLLKQYCEAKGVFYRNRKKKEGFKALVGKVPDSHFLTENNLKYEVNFLDNQNIGFFLDMKPGREFVQKNAQGKKVLNLFSYTCSLSVAAKAGGASHVVNIDMKKSFLKVGEKNHQLNNLEGNVSYLSYEIMKSLKGIEKKGPFDLIIIDPPSFQKSFSIKKDYPKLLSRTKDWLTEKGQIMACLNDPFLKSDFLLESGEGLVGVEKFYGCFDEVDPENGLKMILFNRAEN